MDSLNVQEQVNGTFQMAEAVRADVTLAETVEDSCTNNAASIDAVDCCDSNAEGEDAIADGVKAMHVSVASSVDDDGQSSVEILSPAFNHYKQTEEPSVLEATVPAEKLRAMLKTQLEYYFSPENLSQDKYLLTQMDRDQWVPISIIAGFNQVKRLTYRVELVTEVLKESAMVEVDEVGQKVRPASKRRTIILREIPEGTKKEDIEALFQGDGCPKFVDCVFAHNEHWYVTFINEEEAQRALFYLREKGRTFNGEPIKARLKAGLPLAVSTSSYVRPGQNGIVSVPSYDVSTASAATATVAISLPPKCAYTQLPTVQYIQHPTFPYFQQAPLWQSVYIANDQLAAAAVPLYPAAIPTHVAPAYHPAAATCNVGYLNARQQQRARRGSGGGYRGGSSMQSGRQQSATVDGAGSAASSGNQQPPRFTRRHADQQSADVADGSASVTSNGANGSPAVTNASHSVSAANRTVASVNASARGGCERNSGATRAVASAQGNHISPASYETSSGTGSDAPSGHSHSNYGRSPASRRGGGAYRGRRRAWNDDSSLRGEQRKARETENFELEPTSFPPLPGNSAQNTVTSGDIAAATESKTLSDVVKGVCKSSATGGDKPHAAAPATSITSRQQTPLAPPLTPAPHVANCDGEAIAAAPVSNTVSVTRGRISRSTSTDNLVPVAAELPVSSANEPSTSGAVNAIVTAVQNVEESKPRQKLSYAEIAQRGKENNENSANTTGTGNASNPVAEHNSCETTSEETTKDVGKVSASHAESSLKVRAGSSAPLEQRQPTNVPASHLKNSRFPAGRGGSFAGNDPRHRQRVYNGVATVGASKH